MGKETNEMKKMEIEYLSPDKLKPYKNNPRHNDDAVEAVMHSIEEFGFKVPIVIDSDNVIIAGHTRLKASKKLGYTEIPCIRADDLTEDQVKAFRIADNSVSALATWDFDKLEIELEDINIDMSQFSFDLEDEDFEKIDIPDDSEEEDEEEDDGWYGDERERTYRGYHLELIDWSLMTEPFWQMPIIENNGVIPSDLIGFNYAKTYNEKKVGIHFFIDDYQFERVWSYPEKYVEILSEYECILSPDFSLYMDMPMPMKIWNIYRSRLVGQYYQSQGINVIPTISWAEPETYDFAFKGVPRGSIVAVSTIGVKESKDALEIWRDGMKEMIEQIEPQTILVYGGELELDYRGIKVVHYRNRVLDKWETANGRKRSP